MVIICSHYVALTISADDIVVACGGFVKSDVEINYSLIEVGINQETYVAKFLVACKYPNLGALKVTVQFCELGMSLYIPCRCICYTRQTHRQ